MGFDTEECFQAFFSRWKLTYPKKLTGIVALTQMQLETAMAEAWKDGAIASAEFVTELSSIKLGADSSAERGN